MTVSGLRRLFIKPREFTKSTNKQNNHANQHTIMPMRNTITLRKREVYGNELYYVVDKDQAKAISILTGQKTVTERNIGALKLLGYTITYV